MKPAALRATLAAATFYLLWALVITWPLVLDLRHSLFGAVPGDLSGAIAHAREVVDERIFPFAPATIDDFNAPNGLQEPWVLNIATAPGTALLYGLSYLLGPIAGHEVFMLSGFAASGTAMFLLAQRTTGNSWAAAVGGAAFAFYPFAVNKGLGHLHFVHGWVVVVAVWRLIVLGEAPNRRNGLLAGAAVAFAMWFTPYFILITGSALCALAFIAVVRAAASGAPVGHVVKAQTWCLLPVVTLLVGLSALQFVASPEAGSVRRHSLDELTAFSARLHEYVIPDRNHPLFGSVTRPYLERHIHSSNFSESSLYLGLPVVALAVAGAATHLRRRSAVWVSAAAALVVTGLVCSLPPKVHIAGLDLPMPAWFVFQVTSTWRVFSRFIILAMLGVALLAAAGVKTLLVRLRPPLIAPVAIAVLALVLCDLWARPPGAVTTPAGPEVYRVLRMQPPGLVADYPIEPASAPNATAIWYQGVHGKPIINGFPEGSEDESRKLELADLGDAETAPELARLGVRYAVVGVNYRGGQPSVGFELIHRDSTGAALYRVTADPAKAGVDALSGFTVPEGPPNAHYRWLGEQRGRIAIWAACDHCRGTLVFQTSSAGRPRTLSVTDGQRLLFRQLIPTDPLTVTVPVSLENGEAILWFTTDPGPLPGAPGDPRTLAVTLGEPSFLLSK